LIGFVMADHLFHIIFNKRARGGVWIHFVIEERDSLQSMLEITVIIQVNVLNRLVLDCLFCF